MQQPENHSPEEIERLREFAYRAFSPDSEPPTPQKEEKREKPDSVKKDTESDNKKEERQSA